MPHKNLLRLIGGVALIVAGLVSVLVGIVVAIFVGADWLLISLIGIAVTIIGITIVGSEVRRAIKIIKKTFLDHRDHFDN